MAAFASLLRSRRRDLRLSQEAVAAIAFDNPSRKTWISALENVRQPSITLDTVMKLANALEIAPEQLPEPLRPETPPSLGTPTTIVTQSDIASAFNAQLLKELEWTILRRYQVSLRDGLELLRHWTGRPFSIQSFAVSFALTYIYVALTGLIAFGAGHGGLGQVTPFERPDWAQGVPSVVLALVAGAALFGFSYSSYRLLGKQSQKIVSGPVLGVRLLGGALCSGAGCLIAGLLGAQPIAVALVAALAGFAAVASWPPRTACLVLAMGAFVAGFGNELVNKDGLALGLGEFVAYGVIPGAAIGALTSMSAARIPGVGPSALASAGGTIALGLLCAAFIFAASPKAANDLAQGTEVLILMWFVLPIANAISDYVSLGISHVLGLKLMEKQPGWAKVILMTCLDCVAAVVLVLLSLSIISKVCGLSEMVYGLDIGTREFLFKAATDPWGEGLWLSLMIATTLFWTSLHLCLVIAPIIAAKVVETTLELPAASRLRENSHGGKLDVASSGSLILRHTMFRGLWLLFAMLPLYIIVVGLPLSYSVLSVSAPH